MKKKILSLGLALVMLISLFTISVYSKERDIVILYENDVHCEVDGYAKISAMRNELKEEHAHVGVVSSGDFIQGGTLGSVSRGEYIINIMNLVGYDAVALGNHEFDFYLERLWELEDILKAPMLSCNFYKKGEDEPCFSPYTIVSYGDVDIAYVGITTGGTAGSTNPKQFKNENDEFIYTFNDEILYDLVQKSVDGAKEEGADIIIALSHMGDVEDGNFKLVQDVIENTHGLDVVLDGHAHSVIEGRTLKNKLGEDVLLSSTGTGFEYIGKLTIKGDEITTELIKTEDYEKTDPKVKAYLDKINEEYSVLGDRKIAYSEISLETHSEDGVRLVRIGETSLGNICSEAYYTISGADVAYVNGGGMRSPLNEGDITFNDIYKLFPFNNKIVVIKLDGKTLLDMMELSTMGYPEEDGSFPHLTGMRFKLDTSIPSSVELGENEVFLGVGGEYRIYDVEILNRATKKYEALDLNKDYTIAGIDYYLLDQGGGATMVKGAEVVINNGVLDVEYMETYFREYLGGVIGEEYSKFESNITFTYGKGDALKRGEVVSYIYDLEGRPEISKESSFADVPEDGELIKALSWAKENGIVYGINENEFAPDEPLKREELVTILYRYALYKGMDALTMEENLHFVDRDEISEYALLPFNWAAGKGLFNEREYFLRPSSIVVENEAIYMFESITQLEDAS